MQGFKHQNIRVRLNEAKSLNCQLLCKVYSHNEWKILCFWWIESQIVPFNWRAPDFRFVFDEVNPSFLHFPPPDISAFITRERERERRIGGVSCVVAAPFSILTAGWLARFTFLDLIRAVSMFVSVSASFYLLGEPNRSGVNILSLWIKKETLFKLVGFIWELFHFCVCVADHSNIFGRNLLINR